MNAYDILMLTIHKEFDLHVAIVKFIRDKYPQAVIIPGLGELQNTEDSRIKSWQKGYTAGKNANHRKPGSFYSKIA